MQPADGEAAPSGIGRTLSASREEQGLEVSDISARTRIRATLIRQIEADDYSGCGGAVYARGHIRSIARALSLDADPLVAQFDREQGRITPQPTPMVGVERDPIAARDLRARRGPRWVPAMVVSLVVVFALALVALITGTGSSASSKPPAAPKRVVAAPTHPATATPKRTAGSAPVAFSGVDVRVAIQRDPSWLSVRDSTHRVLLQQVLQPGEVRDFKAAQQIQLVLGNAGAVSMTCNGHDFGSAGATGQVVNVTFGLGSAGDCTAG
ncbi:MAG: helix-turn-helix domain-containing protein [Frankia sp.]